MLEFLAHILFTFVSPLSECFNFIVIGRLFPILVGPVSPKGKHFLVVIVEVIVKFYNDKNNNVLV